MNLDLPPDVVARATGDLVDLYYKRRPLAAAKADILVHKTRATLRALQTDSHERAVHAAIVAGNVTALPICRDKRESRSESAQIVQFPQRRAQVA